MIYDRLPVALLSLLSTEERDAPNAQIARYLVAHADTLEGLSVRELAGACHVGTGTISRFAKDAGFENFADLRQAFAEVTHTFEPVPGDGAGERGREMARRMTSCLEQVVRSIDHTALARLVDDLHAYERVSTYGLLKAQAAALDLQVDLLMQGKVIDTCTQLAEQARRIGSAGRNELVIVFSYTGTYFDACNLDAALRRLDRPRIWMVCGARPQLPPFVSDCLSFSSDGSRFGHPYQLEYVASLIAQEYALR